MQIDHDPNEPSHRALKIIGVATAIVVLALAIPVAMGVRWFAHQLPVELVYLFGFGSLMFAIGFFVGRWDTLRQFRTPNRGE